MNLNEAIERAKNGEKVEARPNKPYRWNERTRQYECGGIHWVIVKDKHDSDE